MLLIELLKAWLLNNQDKNEYVKTCSTQDQELLKADNIEKCNASPPKHEHSIRYALSGSFNILNIIKITNKETINNPHEGVDPFHKMFQENFIDMKPLLGGGNSLYPFTSQIPNSLRRQKLMDNYRILTDSPNEMVYAAKTKAQMLGNMVKSHPVNRLSESDVKMLQEIGVDVNNHPLQWTPTHKFREHYNNYLQYTDYSRFLFHCNWHELETDTIEIDEKEEINSVKYWYKDSSNNPSTIRPLKFTDIIDEFSTRASRFTEHCSYSRYIDSPIFQEKTFLKKNLLKGLKNKIIVIEHRRINLTSGHDENSCPILVHYINNGWKLIDQAEGFDPYCQLFKNIANHLKTEPMEENIDYGGYNLGTYESGYYVGETFHKDKDLRSVMITKTTFLDVNEIGLNDTDGIYVKEVDLVIGKIKSITSQGRVTYPVDYVNHPSSVDGFELKCETRKTLELVYVNKKTQTNTPIYFCTHGLISTIKPSQNLKMKDGLYIISRQGGAIKEIHEIDWNSKLKYGIFTTYEDALTYKQVTEKFLNDLKDHKTHNIFDQRYLQTLEIDQMKFKLEKMKGDTAKELLQTSTEIKQLEQETKMKELQHKSALLELEIKKLNLTQLPANIALILKPIVEISNSIVRGISLMKSP